MRFYAELGFLAFGSRLRRLSEQFLAAVNRVYQDLGMNFDASWFPLFYVLRGREALTMMEISQILEVSHSNISQQVQSLKDKGLLQTERCVEDGRRQLVTFSPAGLALLEKLEPVWEAIAQTMDELSKQHPSSASLLKGLSILEKNLENSPLEQRIQEHLTTKTCHSITEKKA
jgi:DNA-binding MarR family transcriptional regulator